MEYPVFLIYFPKYFHGCDKNLRAPKICKMVVSQWFMQTWRKLGDFGNWSSDVLEYLAPEPLKMSRCLKHTESCIFFQRYSNNSIERWHYMDQDEADSRDATLGGSWEYANDSASWPTCNCWIEHQESQDKKGHLQGMSWQKGGQTKAWPDKKGWFAKRSGQKHWIVSTCQLI